MVFWSLFAFILVCLVLIGCLRVGEGGGNAAPAAAASSTAPAAPAASPAPSGGTPSPTPTSSPASSPSSVGSGAASPGSAATTGTATPASVRDQLRQYGIDPSSFADDSAAIQHLVLAHRQAQQQNQMQPYAQRYFQHAAQFEAWMQQQQAQEAQKQQQSWWKAPEYNPAWRNQVQRDPTTGQLVAGPGASPDVVQKLQAWNDHQLGFLDKFAQDPVGSIRPGIEQVVNEVAQRLVQQQLQGYHDQQYTNDYLQQNQWLFMRDQQGQQVLDQNRQPVLSNEGRIFRQYLNQASQMGIGRIQDQQQYALGMTQRDLALSRLQAPTPAAANDAAKQQFLQAAAGNHIAHPGTPGAQVVPPTAPGASLAQRMSAAFQANGFNPHTPIPVGTGTN